MTKMTKRHTTMKPIPTINRPSLTALAAVFLIPVALTGTANAALVAHWELNETSGTTATSTVNSPAADGTLNGNAAFGGAASPAPGSTASLSLGGGNASHGMQADKAAMFVDGSFSVATWLYATSTPSVPGFLGVVDATVGGYHHNYQLRAINGDFNFKITDQNGNNAGAWGGTVPLNEWVHVALTFDHTSGVAKIYENGIETGTATMPAFTGFSLAEQDTAGIGDFSGGDNPNGLMDDVAVWDETLSETQIANVIANGAAGYNVPEPATMSLLLLGGLGVLARRRRR